MKSRFAALFLFLVTLASPAFACTGDWERDEPVTVAAIDARLDVLLADGRRIRLAGLAPQPADAAALPELEVLRRAAESESRAKTLLLRLISTTPDRWGRLPGLLLPEPDAAPFAGLSARFAADGLARIGDLAEAGECAARLGAAEQGARTARLGLWADPYYAVRDAAQTKALREAAGQFVVVEGRVRRVGRGRQRLYLDFGPGRQDFAVTIAMRTVRLLERQDIRPLSLRGRAVRVRGWLDLAEGPRLDLAGPGYIDLLPEAR